LINMHKYCRPSGDPTTESFCNKYLDHLAGMTIDKAGNRILRIGTAPVLWSSHTDTVHKDGGMQKLAYGDGFLFRHDQSKSNCLGADCTVGVWLMLNMIRAGKEGLYIFHDSEEVGCIGSNYIADDTPHILKDIDYAIAFDRRGTESIITHQLGDRCCSPAFAGALADALGGDYAADPSGTFTDTASYTHLIPECTNISVGYYNAHTRDETLDIAFALRLLERLLRLEVGLLPVLRDPAIKAAPWSQDNYGYNKYTRHFVPETKMTLLDMVRQNPEEAAEMLEALGIDEAYFEDYLRDAEPYQRAWDHG
jgi:hypothetical protein